MQTLSLDLTDPYILITQAIGVVAFGLFTLSYQILKPRHTILLQSLAHAILTIHLFMLVQFGFITFVAFFAMFRDLGSALLERRRDQMIVLGAFAVVIGAAALFLAQEISDIYALIGISFATIAQVFRERFYIYRFCTLVHQVFWLLVYMMVSSIPGIIFLSMILLSNIIGITRYALKSRS